MSNETNNMNEQELIKKVEAAAERGAEKGAKKARITSGGFGCLGKLIILLVLVLVVASSVVNGINGFKEMFHRESAVEDHDLALEDHGFFGYKVADFAEAIIKDGKQEKKLEVYKVTISDTATITQAGFAKLKAFSKCQAITYNGTAVYTVDLKGISEDDIKLDENKKVVTMYIPHPVREEITIPRKDIKFGELKKGKLTFGEIKMTAEESTKVEAEAVAKMEKKLENKETLETADRFAKMSVWEIYQPIVTGVSPAYQFKVEFKEAEQK